MLKDSGHFQDLCLELPNSSCVDQWLAHLPVNPEVGGCRLHRGLFLDLILKGKENKEQKETISLIAVFLLLVTKDG